MAKPNAFLERMEVKAATRELMSTAEGIAHTKQAMIDSIILTLGYGSCMKNDKWGEGRIMAFVKECMENYSNEVFPGIEVRHDADGFRQKTDERIAQKCPQYFKDNGPWPSRYPFWKELTLEQEAARTRRVNKKKNKRRK